MKKGYKFTFNRGQLEGYEYRCSHWREKERDDPAECLCNGTNIYYCVKEQEYKGEMWTYFDYTEEEGPHLIMMRTDDLNKILGIEKEIYEIY